MGVGARSLLRAPEVRILAIDFQYEHSGHSIVPDLAGGAADTDAMVTDFSFDAARPRLLRPRSWRPRIPTTRRCLTPMLTALRLTICRKGWTTAPPPRSVGRGRGADRGEGLTLLGDTFGPTAGAPWRKRSSATGTRAGRTLTAPAPCSARSARSWRLVAPLKRDRSPAAGRSAGDVETLLAVSVVRAAIGDQRAR